MSLKSGFDVVGCWWQATRQSLQKPYRAFVILPLMANLLAIGWTVWTLLRLFNDNWLVRFTAWLPDWIDPAADWIYGLLLGTFFTLTLPLLILLFTLLANLLAAPFAGLLAERVMVHQNPDLELPPMTLHHLTVMIARTLKREMQKLAWYVPKALVLMLFSIIPFINLVMPVVWVFFGAWVLALQYLDYGAEIEGLNFNQTRGRLRENAIPTLGFGLIALLGTLVPILNFWIIPVAVISASLLWSRSFQKTDLS